MRTPRLTLVVAAAAALQFGGPVRLVAQPADAPPPTMHAPAGAQASNPQRPVSQPVVFPGHVSIGVAYLSPIERRNLLSGVSVEQGFSLWSRGQHALVPYVGVRLSMDEQGLDWHNKALGLAGLKYVLSFARGLIEAGAGYAHEHRLESRDGMGQPLAFATYWIEWGPEPSADRQPPRRRSFPGNSWGTVGNQAPAEGNNVIAMVRLEQGVTAARLGRLALVPMVEALVTKDAAGRTWNNLAMFGEGIKLTVPVPGGAAEIGWLYRHEHRWIEGESGRGAGGFVTLRYGWKPLARDR